MSTNRSPFTSRLTRKQNYESANQPSPFQTHQPLRSSHQHPLEPSIYKKNLQQKQIEDLQQKVDLILQHNDKLSVENNQLKKRLAQAEVIGSEVIQKQRLSRYQMAEERQYAVRKINNQLIIKTRDLQNIIQQYHSFKQASIRQIESMKQIIHQHNISYQILKQDNTKLVQEFMNYKQQSEQELRMQSRQSQRKIQQEIGKLVKEHSQILEREKKYQEKVIAELEQKFQEERKQWNNRKSTLITKLQDTHNRQINQLREQLINDFNRQIQKLSNENQEKCKQERDKADKFIKQFIQNLGPSNDSEMDILRGQIKTLQQSLDSRKKLIDQLTSQDVLRQDYKSNISQIIVMKERLKEQMEHLMRQNQMLKIKMSEKYEKDLKEMVKIYQDKIQVLSDSVRDLSNQNDRLRHNYEDQVTLRIRVRRNAQIEVSQLKNLIRRLKVQLQGVQDEFRLNIDGVREQSATFSMALMKSMVQVKQKSTFHEEQNRKLRMMYDKHEIQVARQKKQAQQKAKYYESRLQHLNGVIQKQRVDLKDKQQMLMRKMDQHQNNLRQVVKREREHLQQLTAQAQQQKDNIQKQYIDLQHKLSECQLDLKQAKDEIEKLTSRLKQNAQYIERLRMQLQMVGTDHTQQNHTLNNWKQHYEGIILKLQEDKKELKSIIDNENQKAQNLTYKYRLLEQELKKAAISLQKRGELDTKIINLGLDQNLIKNMGQIWVRKQNQVQSP